jgi:hypothetical protein
MQRPANIKAPEKEAGTRAENRSDLLLAAAERKV